MTWFHLRDVFAWLALALASAVALPAAFVLLVELRHRGSVGVAFPLPRGAWGPLVRALLAPAVTHPAATLLVAAAVAAIAWGART